MILINKQQAPQSLTYYRQQRYASYASCEAEVKQDIKLALLREQKYLCAYCNAKIDISNMKIEHFIPQSCCPDLELDYANLHGVCHGQEGKKWDDLTCDSKKGNTRLSEVSLTNRVKILSIKYKKQGEIFSEDSTLNYELNNILNLNSKKAYFPQNRVQTFDLVKEKLNSTGSWRKQDIERMLVVLKGVDREKAMPFSGHAIFFLEKKLISN